MARSALRMGACVLLTGVALSACTSHHRPERGLEWHSPVLALMKYDSNHDGTLTREELDAGLKAEFDRLDEKHTGCLAPAVVQAENDRRWKEDAATYSPIIDWNRDGCVNFKEYSTTAHSLFDSLDTNSDGKVSPPELHANRGPTGLPASPPPHAGGGGGGGYP